MMYRTQQMVELLRRCHKVEFTIDYEDVYQVLNLEKYVDELKKDSSLEITILKVNDEMKITVELKE